MTAYNFKRQFVGPIRAGTKIGTIRAHRKRHARVGEAMQLYCGMRTKGCFKIIDDVTCRRVNKIEIIVSTDPALSDIISNGVQLLKLADRNAFAIEDGFASFEDMIKFWNDMHGPFHFRGVHLIWGR